MKGPTPGPWTFDDHGGCFYVWGPGHRMVADGDPEGDEVVRDYVARMRGVGRGASGEEQRANARLIAAAPDLLEAAKMALEALRVSLRIALPRDTPEQLASNTNITTLVAAIAKAEGR